MRCLERAVMVASLGMSLVTLSATIVVAQIPSPGMEIEREVTALVVMGPQNESFRPEELSLTVNGRSFTENNTVENIKTLPKVENQKGNPLFILPQDSYLTDYGWKFEGALQKLMPNINMFDRKGALSLARHEGSGMGWLARYKPYIEGGKAAIGNARLEVGDFIGGSTTDLLYGLRGDGYIRVGWRIDL